MIDFTTIRYGEDGYIHVVIDGSMAFIPDDVVEQELRDPETEELTGETVRVATSWIR
jgi:hypothetical protein